jgi:energy-coupling factor transport system permease protein
MSPLHAARAGAGAAWTAALVVCALLFEHPLVLCALCVAVLAAGAATGASAQMSRALRLCLLAAPLIVAINLVANRNGLTVFWRLGEIPPFGQLDLTVESLAYGGALALRLAVMVLAAALFAAAVDVDALLLGARRVSARSALTAVLAVRLVPVLARDARRLDEARRCRWDGGGSGAQAKVAVLRAICAGALDRAGDVAATLEVRGYGTAGRPRRRRVPWSRPDLAFAGAAAAILALAIAGRVAGIASFEAVPALDAPTGLDELALAAALVAVALAPFAVRKGVAR